MWSIALEGKSDLDRFKALNWGLRTWDLWNWNDCLPREIYVNDSEAYFTGVTNVSETIGLPAIASAQARRENDLYLGGYHKIKDESRCGGTASGTKA